MDRIEGAAEAEKAFFGIDRDGRLVFGLRNGGDAIAAFMDGDEAIALFRKFAAKLDEMGLHKERIE